jgi:Tc toxin complex TcA C-terminal TcB-binding domain
LLADLQDLERKYIEQNYRCLEVNQSFSLAQWNPAALQKLKQTGSCDFAIPELFYDLTYPGHYSRRIRALRVSVPCVTGPYANVGATLTMSGSQIRREPDANVTALKTVNLSRADSIATSRGLSDAGVFEFNFRDERFNHFEGAGAVSSWKLSLPKNFRPFDYDSISDVILHVDYSAKEDGAFRDSVETSMAAIQNQVLTYFKDVKLFRSFSLRHEFPTEFNRLVTSPKDTEIDFNLSEKFLPMFAAGRSTRVAGARLALVPKKGQATTGFRIAINGSNRSSFTADDTLGNLPTNDGLEALFTSGMTTQLKLAIKDAGPLSPPAAAAGDGVIDSAKLLDAILVLEYRLVK